MGGRVGLGAPEPLRELGRPPFGGLGRGLGVLHRDPRRLELLRRVVAQAPLRRVALRPRLEHGGVRRREPPSKILHDTFVVPRRLGPPRLGRGQVQHEPGLGRVARGERGLGGAHALPQVRRAGARRGVGRRDLVARRGDLLLQRPQRVVALVDAARRGGPRLGQRGPQVVLDGRRREGVVLDGALGVGDARTQVFLRCREARLRLRRRRPRRVELRAQRNEVGVRLRRVRPKLRRFVFPRRQRRLGDLEPLSEVALRGGARGGAPLERGERRLQSLLLRRERRRVAPGRLELGLEVPRGLVGRGGPFALQLRDAPLRGRERVFQPRRGGGGLGPVVVAVALFRRQPPVRRGRARLGRVGPRPQLVGPRQDGVGALRRLDRRRL